MLASVPVEGDDPHRITSSLQQAATHFAHGQFSDTKRICLAILKINPQHGEAWKFLGVALKHLGEHGEAIRAMHKAAELLPNDEQAQNNFGAALSEANALAPAESYLRRALAIHPDYLQALNNLGNVLCRQGRLQEAESYQRQALSIQPDFLDALNNLGCTLHDQGRMDEALHCFHRALAIRPDFAEAHWHAGMIALQCGDWDTGWQQYEWRWQAMTFQNKKHHFTQPQWDGKASLHQRTILLHTEQGLGDSIQFCRYAQVLADLGARVILLAPAALQGLFTGLAGVHQLFRNDIEAIQLPPFDFHCPLLSLPMACHTSLSNIPANIPYLFAQAQLARTWQQRLPATSGSRIGIAWRGNPLHRHDYRRSIPLATFAHLLHDRSKFICLQQELQAEEHAIVKTLPSFQFFGEALTDFSDTAALIDSLDLVICVDTAIAHLAAAMGKPVWILLPYQADWRWLTGRDDSPWYPNVRLFRQQLMGDWHSVLEAVAQAMP